MVKRLLVAFYCLSMFIGCGGDGDGFELTVATMVPNSGATEIELDQVVMVIFNRRIQQDTAKDAISVTMTDTQAPVAGSAQVDEDRLVFLSDADFEVDTSYNVTVAGKVQAADGDASLGSDASWSFSTLLPLELVSTVPTANATGVSLTDDITLTFTDNVDAATVTLGSVTLTANGATAPDIALDVTDKTIIITPNAAMAPNVEHEIVIGGSVKSQRGQAFANPANAPTLTFTTGS